ncbi:MAG: hypothetical protein LBH20_11690 [Treponema sp.]|jgi:hypothetical protein|nr:hypothetical protein [Treponema sp.]
MSNFESEFPSTETLIRLRNTALFYFISGLVLAVIQFLARQWVIAAVAGIIICAVGIGWLMANNPVNKKTGALITAIGVMVTLSKTPIKPLTVLMGTLLSITIIGFLAMGVKSLIRYFIAQSKQY